MAVPELPPLVRIYLREALRSGLYAPTTLPSVQSNLMAFCRHVGNIPPSAITAAHVEAWLGSGRLARSTVRHRFSQVRGFCRWLMRRGLLDKDPTILLRAPRQPKPVPRALPAASVADLLAVCPDSRARLVVILMAQLGLRAIEISRLEMGDIDFSFRVVRINGKGGTQRLLPIPEQAWRALGTYLIENPAPAGPVVRSYIQPWVALKPNSISKMLTGLMRAADVAGSGHALRHTMATDLLRSGADVRTVQHALGHESLTSTSIYLPFTDVARLREAMEGRWYGSAAG